MHRTIEFPHIGIHLSGVGDHITVFGFDIAFYGIIIGVGILVGLFIAVSIAKRSGQNPETYYDLVIYGVIFSIIGARAYYVIFSWDMYKDDLLSIFNLRGGGLAIYGGVIGAVITALVYARIKHVSAALILDTVGPAFAAGQMIGRWGNFFNREAFGEYTDSLLAMRIPTDAARASDITELMREHMETVDGVSYVQVHPTFLYESLWCMALCLFLLWYWKRKRFDGEVFLFYLMGYALGRVWIEGLRTDQLILPGTHIPVSQMLAGVLILVSAVAILYFRRKNLAGLKNKE